MVEGKEKKPRRRSRSLTDDERKLWRAVIKDATPISRARKPAPEESPAVLPVEPLTLAPMQQQIARPAPPPPTRAAGPPPLTGLDRRTSQRLARGQMEVEATLDLHGHTQERAQGALLDFLSRGRARGLRCVLVITGKGASPYARHTLHGADFYEVPERQGVLRSALPRWLNEADFRTHVSGFQPAHPKHGGGGAFYIWLRRKR